MIMRETFFLFGSPFCTQKNAQVKPEGLQIRLASQTTPAQLR